MELPAILAALAVFLPIAYGAPVETDDVVLAPVVLEALERDLGLDAAEATARFSFEAKADDVINDLKTTLGDSFKGAWVEDGKTVKVVTSNEGDSDAVKKAGASHEVAKTDLTKVQEAKNALDDKSKRQGRSPSDKEPVIASYYVDVTTSKLVITALPEGLEEAESMAKDVGLSEEEFEVREVPELFKQVTLMGGGGYVTSRNLICSVAFNVHGGFVTAGHCGNAGDSVAYLDRTPVGRFERSTWPGADMAFVSTGGHVQGPPTVGAYGQQGDQAVRGNRPAPVGSGVCRSGNTTGWRCGVINAYDVTVNYSEGPVYGMVTSSACAQPGDSGGSFISGDQAQGITSGAAGNCPGGTSVYQPLNPVLSAYGLGLKTA